MNELIKRCGRASQLAAAVTSALLLAACGGSDSNRAGGGTDNGGGTPGGNTGGNTIQKSGKAADGYLNGATVCLDVNNDKKCGADEPTATTGAGGAFTINVPEGVNAVYELVIDGISLESVVEATRVGVRAACGPGVKRITAGNYGGKLGPHHLKLHEVLG